MSNPSRYGGSLEAAIRAHFGLTQAELARYLGVSERHVGHLEAGRRAPSPTLSRRLHWLADLLPPPEGTGPALPAPGSPLATAAALPLPVALPATLRAALPDFGPLPARSLRARQRQAAAQAAALRRGLHQAAKAADHHARRAAALAVFRAAVSPAAPTPADAARFAHWLGSLAADVAAAAPTPAAGAGHALATLRLLALEAEAAALALLAGQLS